MPQLDDLVVDAIALSGGSVVGHIRMKKVVYLLEKLGMGGGIPFEYHHYGPYAEPLSAAVTNAKFWGKVKEAVRFRMSDGAPYSTFKTDVAPPDRLGELSGEDARRLLEKFAGCTSTVLELAATAHRANKSLLTSIHPISWTKRFPASAMLP